MLANLRKRMWWIARCMAFAFLFNMTCAASLAVVITEGDGTGNTTAPADDPGFENVGIRGIASAVYLGNRWVLTAAHINAGTVTFGNTNYTHDPASVVRVKNPRGLSPNADMVLFQLNEAPSLPALRLPCSAVQRGDEVVMVGRGRNRESAASFWSVSVVSGRNNDVWTRVDTAEEADEVGYQTSSSKTVRWGKNIVTKVGTDIDTGEGDVLSFQTRFDDDDAVENEAHSVTGDSGGAGFSKEGTIWQLSGLIHAVDLKDNQPGRANTAIIGNVTFLADLYTYADELRELADFEPELGDFNGDGEFTAAEIDQLFLEIESAAHVCHFDFNEDDAVNDDDLIALLDFAGTRPGDVDLDGEVAFQDFLTLSRAFGLPGGWADGDLNGNRMVDFGDFLILADNFSGTPAASVPEPGALGLSVFATILALCWRRRSRSA